MGQNKGARGSCPSLQLNRETDRATETAKEENRCDGSKRGTEDMWMWNFNSIVRKESDKEINHTGKFGVGVEHAGGGAKRDGRS